jgi:hypothetical protein
MKNIKPMKELERGQITLNDVRNLKVNSEESDTSGNITLPQRSLSSLGHQEVDSWKLIQVTHPTS